MQLPQRLVKLFDIPVAGILAALPEADSPLWDLNPYRQTRHAVHRQTRSIIFEWIADDWQPGRPAEVQHSPHAPALSRPVYECADRLNAHYQGKIIRLMLTELAPHAAITPHKDGGAGVILVHRLHVPVVSNPAVNFYIDEIAHYLEPGAAYEFDNTRRHAVVNESGDRRVHLMCDILPAALIV